MLVTSMAMMVIVNLLLLGFLSLFAAFVDDLDVVIEYGSDDGDHVGLDHASADILGTPNTDIDNTLESQVPFPHAHHIFAATLLEDAYQTLDSSIDGENITDAG